ncbi:clumping factor A [Cucumis melo var. makuwa]|uniref:Clumping factor A n=1 Tax=Cucumis melo var. makuwa TaxID=1194695 RepID=A0A5A7U740_CUCMM|nr:clumping factor A [Cucumis melo var. makuwa]TYK02698.1 clumping factor A [Cucumis melo var. makuwa]
MWPFAAAPFLILLSVSRNQLTADCFYIQSCVLLRSNRRLRQLPSPPSLSRISRSIRAESREVTLEFTSVTASVVGTNSPLFGWIRLDGELNKEFSYISDVLGIELRRRTVRHGILRDHETDMCILRDHETDICILRDHETDMCVLRDHETDMCVLRHHETDMCVLQDHETDMFILRDQETDMCIRRDH